MSELPTNKPFSDGDDDKFLEFPNIDGYLVQQQLGQGAYGRVFKAIDTSVSAPVAIKVLNPIASQKQDLRERFDREVKAYYAVRDSRIVQPRNHGLISQGAYRGCPFVVMEYMDGGSFEHWLLDHPTGNMSALRVAVQVLIQVCEGLMHLHESEIVHRDLKPANILLAGVATNSDGTRYPKQVRIADFGLAAFLGQSRELSKTGMGAGTPAYMSPEQFVDAKNITPASDQYAIGVMLYQLLCSRRPWQSSAEESEAPGILEAKARSKILPPPPSSSAARIDKQLRKVCLRCLEPKPEDRYRNAEELAEDLRKWMRGEPIADPGNPIRWFYHRRVVQPIKRNPGRFTTITLLFLALAVASVIFVFNRAARHSANAFSDKDAELTRLVEDQNVAEALRRYRIGEFAASRKLISEIRTEHLPWEGLWLNEQFVTFATRTLELPTAVTCVEFLPSKGELYAGCVNGDIFWIGTSGTSPRIIQKSQDNHRNPITSIVIQDSGRVLTASGRIDAAGKIIEFDGSLQEVTRIVAPKRSSSMRADLTETGEIVESGLIFGQARATLSKFPTDVNEPQELYPVSPIGTGRMLAEDRRTAVLGYKVYDSSTMEEVRTLKSPIGEIPNARFLDARQVTELEQAIGGPFTGISYTDGRLVFWNVESGEIEAFTGLASACYRLKVFSTQTSESIYDTAFSGDPYKPVSRGKQSEKAEVFYAICLCKGIASNTTIVRVLEVSTCRVVSEFALPEIMNDVSVDSDLRLVAFAGNSGIRMLTFDALFTQGDNLVQRFNETQERIWDIAYSQDGKMIAIASLDSRIRLLDTFSQELVETFETKSWPRIVVFSGESKIAALTDGARLVEFSLNNSKGNRPATESKLPDGAVDLVSNGALTYDFSGRAILTDYSGETIMTINVPKSNATGWLDANVASDFSIIGTSTQDAFLVMLKEHRIRMLSDGTEKIVAGRICPATNSVILLRTDGDLFVSDITTGTRYFLGNIGNVVDPLGPELVDVEYLGRGRYAVAVCSYSAGEIFVTSTESATRDLPRFTLIDGLPQITCLAYCKQSGCLAAGTKSGLYQWHLGPSPSIATD